MVVQEVQSHRLHRLHRPAIAVVIILLQSVEHKFKGICEYGLTARSKCKRRGFARKPAALPHSLIRIGFALAFDQLLSASPLRILPMRIFSLLLFSFFVRCASAQTVPAFDQIQNQQELDKAGAALDAALFDSYNKRDLAKFESFFVDDVEFYHDQGGVTLGKKALTEGVKNNICGKRLGNLCPAR